MFQIRVSLDQSLTNGVTVTNEFTVTANSPDSQSGNDRASVETTITTAAPGTLDAELELSKSAPSAIGAGGVLTFTLQVKNNGPLNATTVQITDPRADLRAECIQRKLHRVRWHSYLQHRHAVRWPERDSVRGR